MPLFRLSAGMVATGALLSLAAAAPAAVPPAAVPPVVTAPAAGPAVQRAPIRHVIIVGVAGLLWSDVSPDRTPVLAALARAGSIGALSVRAAPAPPHVTCSGEGWLTLGAGSYAAVVDPDTIDPDRGCADRQAPPVQPAVRSTEARVPALPDLYRLNGHLRFGARPGVLGTGPACVTAVGPGAALAVADRSGAVGSYAADLPADPGPLLARCPVTAVDLGEVPDHGARAARLAAVDRALGAVSTRRPAGSVLMVLGVAEAVPGNGPRLHVATVVGGGFEGGWLLSSSTRRAPYVQLGDVAPTALRLLGRAPPPGLAGLPLRGGGAGRPAADRDLAMLIDADTAAVAQRGVVGAFFVGYGVLVLLVLGGLAVLGRRRREAVPRVLGVVAVALASVPVATFLANLTPWWRASRPVLAVGAAVVAAAALVAALALGGPWRRRAAGPAVAVAALTVAVLAVDALTGTTLQINSLFGYNPLVAGRFTGFGNLAFAVFGTASALLVAFVAVAVRTRLGERAAAGSVAALGGAVIAVDGAPDWGADFGGVLTLIPVFVILALLVSGVRVRLVPLLAAGVAGLLVALTIGVLDHLRPPESRSHFGRFVGGLLDGTAGATVLRKLSANLDLLLAGPHTLAALALGVLLSVWVVSRPPALTGAYTRVPALRPAALSVVALVWIAFATNDSGVAIPLVAALVAVPVGVAAGCVGYATKSTLID
jgi:hypothetical protein